MRCLADEAQPTLAMFTLGSGVQPGPMPSYPDVPKTRLASRRPGRCCGFK